MQWTRNLTSRCTRKNW